MINVSPFTIRNNKMTKPTSSQYGAYEQAWEYFSKELFGGKLEHCMLTFSVRNPKSNGHFIANKWTTEGFVCHEISLNPDQLERPFMESMGTLVHEMVHQWQQDFGKPPRKCYHDAQWAKKMEAVGLMPSSTGEPGGKRTGQNMSHYVIPGGVFERAVEAMPDAYKIPWMSSGMAKAKQKQQRRSKYVCEGRKECGVTVWGVTGLDLCCMQHTLPLIEVMPKEDDDD